MSRIKKIIIIIQIFSTGENNISDFLLNIFLLDLSRYKIYLYHPPPKFPPNKNKSETKSINKQNPKRTSIPNLSKAMSSHPLRLP